MKTTRVPFTVAFPRFIEKMSVWADKQNEVNARADGIHAWVHHGRRNGIAPGNEKSDFLRWVAIHLLDIPAYVMDTAGIDYRAIAAQFVTVVSAPRDDESEEEAVIVRGRGLSVSVMK